MTAPSSPTHHAKALRHVAVLVVVVGSSMVSEKARVLASRVVNGPLRFGNESEIYKVWVVGS